MGTFEDLTGQRFGKLTVIKRGEDKFSPKGRRKIMWICECECGKEITVYGGNLKSGNTQSCGCKNKGILLHDLTGKRFGYYTVIERTENKNGRTMWKCRCDCGEERIVFASNLVRGLTRSCGCKQRDLLSDANKVDISGKKFGKLTVLKMLPDTRGDALFECLCDCGNKTVCVGRDLKNGHTKSCGCLSMAANGLSYDRIYREWLNMRQRCQNEKHISYKDYGGRGIKVCDEWDNSFLAFHDWAMVNGYNDSLSIDRIDVDGNYEPSNCQWITMKEQQSNKRNNVFLTYCGETKSVSEWSKITGISISTLNSRRRKGWSEKDCIEKPVKNSKNKSD